MSRRVRELWLRAKAEGKKAVMLAALLGVCAILGLRAAVFGGKPRHAASPASAAPQPAAPSASAPDAAGAERPDAPALDLTPPRRYARGGAPTRDLYALNPRFFPDVTGVRSAGREGGAKSATGADDKSGEAAPTDAQSLRRRATADAARLRVRSVIVGAQPAAVIEREEGGARKAEALRVGEKVCGFVVAEITATGVRLERDGAEVVLEIAVRKNEPR